MSTYVTVKEVQKLIEVSGTTLQRWANNGKVSCKRTLGGKRRYDLNQIKQLVAGTGSCAGDATTMPNIEQQEEEKKENTITKVNYCYCRVSSDKQKEDLERQVQDCRRDYPQHQIIKDIGSGLNFKRKGLQTILERAHQGMVNQVVVRNRDRLCRFGYELIEYVLRQNGVQLLVHGKEDQLEEDRHELADDLIAVTNFFVARSNGKRSAANRRERKKKSGQVEQGAGEEGQQDEGQSCESS